jgi:hypothetical protein
MTLILNRNGSVGVTECQSTVGVIADEGNWFSFGLRFGASIALGLFCKVRCRGKPKPKTKTFVVK